MGEKVELKPEGLLNLDELLQCPVCYEIPTGQIFQCNEGHHVCGRCKVRLDVCPVCRALFFGTRNYAMEELIANFRKHRAFKSGKAASDSSSSSTTTKDATSVEPDTDTVEDSNDSGTVNQPLRPPLACRGLFRCLCCKIGKSQRLPTARLLNHLRYFHAPDLIEGRSENGEYLQAWHFSTVPGRIVTAVRVADMGIFFFVIEIICNAIHAWLTMASSPWVAQGYNYTITLSGVDREAIFNDCVWSVRSCEGTLKKRGHSLVVTGTDARALLTPAALSGKLSVRRLPPDQVISQTQPRAVMRVANRGTEHISPQNEVELDESLEPFLEDLQNNINRLSREFASFVRSETQMRAANEGAAANRTTSNDQVEENTPVSRTPTVQAPAPNGEPNAAVQPMSRNARRRLRQQLRAAMNEAQGLSNRNAQSSAAVAEEEVELIGVVTQHGAVNLRRREENLRSQTRLDNSHQRSNRNTQSSAVVEEPEVELTGVVTQHGAVNARRREENLRSQTHLNNSHQQLVNGHNTNGSSTEQSASGTNPRTNRRVVVKKRRQRR